MGYKDGLNFYAYVNNDSMNQMDPSGLACTKKAAQEPMCVVDFTVEGSSKNPETRVQAAELAERVTDREITAYDFEKTDENGQTVRAEATDSWSDAVMDLRWLRGAWVPT